MLKKQPTLLGKLEEARTSVKKVDAQFFKETIATTQAHKQRKLLEADPK